jgi:transposase-like protein
MDLMGRWIERNPNWLNKNSNQPPDEKIKGRPNDDSLEYGVRYVPVKCPRCKSKNVMCYASRIPVRYHKCRKCGTCFKSVEETDK